MRGHRGLVTALLLLTVIGAAVAQQTGSIASLQGRINSDNQLVVAAAQHDTWTIDANVINVPSVNVANLVPTSAPTYAVSPCTIVTTASTNATQCADAPANVYGVYYAINTTTTPAFMRVIDDASSITCTDTPVFVVPIPASSDTGVYGGVALPWVNPVNFAAGVAVCVTSGSDGTGNAPAGIIILVGVKE